MSEEYKCVSSHPEDLEPDGRVVAPGERIELFEEEVSQNARLFAEDRFIAVDDAGGNTASDAVDSYNLALETAAREATPAVGEIETNVQDEPPVEEPGKKSDRQVWEDDDSATTEQGGEK